MPPSLSKGGEESTSKAMTVALNSGEQRVCTRPQLAPKMLFLHYYRGQFVGPNLAPGMKQNCCPPEASYYQENKSATWPIPTTEPLSEPGSTAANQRFCH